MSSDSRKCTRKLHLLCVIILCLHSTNPRHLSQHTPFLQCVGEDMKIFSKVKVQFYFSQAKSEQNSLKTKTSIFFCSCCEEKDEGKCVSAGAARYRRCSHEPRNNMSAVLRGTRKGIWRELKRYWHTQLRRWKYFSVECREHVLTSVACCPRNLDYVFRTFKFGLFPRNSCVKKI